MLFRSDIYPDFTEENCETMEVGGDDESIIEYFNEVTYARYNTWTGELLLRTDLFNELSDYFGEELMTFVIDWFNKEFKEDATSVTY